MDGRHFAQGFQSAATTIDSVTTKDR